jgi:hypothetical protein
VGTAQELLASDTASGFPSAEEAMGSARATIAGWNVQMGPIFVSNSLPYIVRLDQGWSAKAPQGMVKQAITACRAELKRKLNWK